MPKLLAPTLALIQPYEGTYYRPSYSRIIGHINIVVWPVELTSYLLRTLAYLSLIWVHYIRHVSPVLSSFINPVFWLVELTLWFLHA